MHKSNEVVLSFILLLVSISLFSHKSAVFGSSATQEQSFRRPDPLNKFREYDGGYDIRNKHYWASAAFTGLYGYVIAGVWVLLGLGFGGYVILKNFRGSSAPVVEHPDSSYIILFSLVVLFTLLAIISSGVVIAAEQISIRKTKILKQTVLGASGDARRTIHKIRKVLGNMQTLLSPYDPKTCRFLNSTRDQLGKESLGIRRFVDKGNHSGDLAIETLQVTNLLVVAINLALLVGGIVQLFMHWHPGFIIIIFLCWSLTTINWILTGFDFFFNTFAKDTCSTFADFELNQNNSLRTMLSCGKSSASGKILDKVGLVVHDFITQLNSKRTVLRNFVPEDEQNEDLLNGEICDPFSNDPNHSFTTEKCPRNAIPIGDIPKVLARYTCYNQNSSGSCKEEKRFIPEDVYLIAWAYSESMQDLINIFPDFQNLTQCSCVEQAFSDVVSNQCKPFKTSVRMLWSSMLSLSIVMVVLTLLWVAKAYQDWRHSFSLCSIIPNRA